MTKAEVEQLIQAALEPLYKEIAELHEKLSAISHQPPVVGGKPAQSDGALGSGTRHTFAAPDSTAKTDQPEPLETQNPTTLEPTAAPPERTDFQRFLQRGLEEEQVRYSEEAVSSKPEPKKGGWNPFRR
jgi:phytoene dehydrogenase-like protein